VNSPLKLSIVTPNYNGAGFLRETIESVLNQGYPTLQYVIADGASTDGSQLIFEHYRDDLSAMLSEPDTGHADAINKGFALTNGEIMGWINSDDVLHPGCLSQVARIFETHPEVEWLTGRPSTMNVRSEIDYVGVVRPWSRLRFLAGDHLWIQQESTFWRRSLWDRAGGQLDTSFDVANDFELWARFFRHAPLYSVDRMLGCFRVRPGQRSVVSLARYKREVRTILKRELDALDPEFRCTFEPLIPNRPRELTDEQRDRLDCQLRAMDPPFIRMSKVRNRTSSLSKGGGSHFSMQLKTPEPISELSTLKDTRKGERCVILGNGPSLNRTDLSLLKEETVFACDAVHLLFERIDWRPAYYTCVDSQVLHDRATDIEAMLAADPDMVAFFPTEVQIHGSDRDRLKGRDLVAESPKRYFFNEEPGTVDDLPESMFSLDASIRVIQPHTVAVTMMQLAAYMGFSELVLVGIDMHYSVPDAVPREEGVDIEDVRLTSLQDDDPNHFDPLYFGATRKWNTPNTALMRQHFELARQALDKKGVSVRNATEGGDLDVFELVSLKDAVSRPAAPLGDERIESEQAGEADILPEGIIARRLELWLPSLNRNLSVVAGSTGVILILAVGALMLPDWRVWVAMVGLFGFSFAFSAVVALKSRRILMSMLTALKDARGGEAEARFAFQQLELELDALHAELYELRRESFRGDREEA